MIMHKHRIENYFAEKGINVNYNALGYDRDLIYAFISDFKNEIDKTAKKRSQYAKLQCYRKIYPIDNRPKRTGFENLKEIDNNFRKKVNPFIKTSQFSPLLKISNQELKNFKVTYNDAVEWYKANKLSYKQLLQYKLSLIENPLLYLSGGMDSEIVATAMVEAKIKFTPVILHWTDNRGIVQNSEEISYAYKFCREHNLKPIMEQINVEQLWSSDYFLNLAIDLQLNSTHLVTHAHAIDIMSNKIPNATHLFGGEVRFDTNYIEDNGELANIVYLVKVTPSYDGQFYSQSTGLGNQAGVLVRYFNNGTWDIRQFDGGLFASGVWYSPGTPATGAFEVRSTVTDTFEVNGGQFTLANYTTIGASTNVAEVSCAGAGFEEGNTSGGVFTIFVRKIGETSPVVSATVELACASLGI